MEFKRFANLEQLFPAAAELVAARIRTAVAHQGKASVALAGGSTPVALYRTLAGMDLPWQDTHWFFGDERWVDPGDDDSNLRMVSQSLLDAAPVPDENVHPMVLDAGSDENPEDAARAYQAELEAFFGLAAGQLPRFDVILLGMGPDGHTASLFPGYEPTWEKGLVTATPQAPLPPHVERLSLTLPVLKNGRAVIFLASGEDKREVLDGILGDPLGAALGYPAARVRPDMPGPDGQPAGELFWFWAP